MSNSRDETCGWVPVSNSAPLLRMHDRCEWSIINGLGNELWMCNIIWNRQLNMDRENIATTAPQIVMCSSWTLKDHHQTKLLLTFVRKRRGSVGGERNENLSFIWETSIVYLEKNVMPSIWVNKQNLFLLHPLLFSSVSVLLAFKLLGAREHRLWWVTHSVNVCVFLQTGKISLMLSAVSLLSELKHDSYSRSVVDTHCLLIHGAIPCPVSGPDVPPTTDNPVGQN